MTVISVIFGILMVLGGFSCMFTPLATFLYTGYFIAVMLLVYGILGIARFSKKQAGGLELVISILAVLVGLVSVFRPGRTLIFDGMALGFIGAWLLVQGVASIALSLKVRSEKKGWYWGLIAGILGVIAGLYSFAHPVLTAISVGFLIGLYFVQAGFDMIVLSCAIGKMKDEVQ